MLRYENNRLVNTKKLEEKKETVSDIVADLIPSIAGVVTLVKALLDLLPKKEEEEKEQLTEQ